MIISVTEWIFGIVTLASFMFAIYTYYKKRASIFALLEKLRASRNNFYALDQELVRIAKVVETNELSDVEKIKIVRQFAHSMHENMWTNTNTIDDGKDWGKFSIKMIYKTICK